MRLRRWILFWVVVSGISRLAAESSPDLEPSVAPAAYAECPQSVLRNGALTLRVMHPDAKKGFYRGGRFEWSGIIAEAYSPAHRYIGHTSSLGEPLLSLGTSSEFKPPIEIPVGKGHPARQIRIGIGAYVSDQSTDVEGNPEFRLEKLAAWSWKVKENSISYLQELRDVSGYAYDFRKTIALDPVKPEVTITYFLENTGERTIHTTHYCHDWFCLDDAGVGRNYELTFPFSIQPHIYIHDARYGARLDGGRIAFFPKPTDDGAYWLALHPVEGVANNAFLLRNRKTGAFIRYAGDWSPVYFTVYATPEAFCPEAYYEITLQPGESRTWTAYYVFGGEPPQP